MSPKMDGLAPLRMVKDQVSQIIPPNVTVTIVVKIKPAKTHEIALIPMLLVSNHTLTSVRNSSDPIIKPIPAKGSGPMANTANIETIYWFFCCLLSP